MSAKSLQILEQVGILIAVAVLTPILIAATIGLIVADKMPGRLTALRCRSFRIIPASVYYPRAVLPCGALSFRDVHGPNAAPGLRRP